MGGCERTQEDSEEADFSSAGPLSPTATDPVRQPIYVHRNRLTMRVSFLALACLPVASAFFLTGPNINLRSPSAVAKRGRSGTPPPLSMVPPRPSSWGTALFYFSNDTGAAL